MEHTKRHLAYADYYDKVYGCFLGKCIGGTAGGPAEGRKELLDFPLNEELLHKCLPNDDLDLQILWLELIETIGVSYQPAVPARPYCPHLCFEADDMDEVLAVLRKHGIPILDGPNEIPGSEQWIYFTDPDGNVLEYIVWLDKHKSETP